MAKRSASSTKTKSTRSTRASPVSRKTSYDYVDETVESIRKPLKTGHAQRGSIKEFFTSPAVKYVAGGIATAVLAKVASNLSDRYPEISRFLSENLEGIETRLAEFKHGLDEETVSRH